MKRKGIELSPASAREAEYARKHAKQIEADQLESANRKAALVTPPAEKRSAKRKLSETAFGNDSPETPTTPHTNAKSRTKAAKNKVLAVSYVSAWEYITEIKRCACALVNTRAFSDFCSKVIEYAE